MQHPDEGMIHSWLDGALSAEEATQMESHVATCPSCATAVAEARGFIAASSRILTALDDVPGGVVPAIPARKRDLRVFWRAAAAMLVVAGGSLVVMREGGQDAVTGSTASSKAGTLTPSTPAPSQDAAGTGAVGAPTRMDEMTSSQPLAAFQSKPMSTPSRAGEGRTPRTVEQELAKQPDLGRAKEPASVVVGGTAMTGAVTSGTRTMQLQANVAAPESEGAPLKVLRVERTAGSRRTTYEIAPAQTVTLTEPESVQRSGIVLRGAAAGQRQATTGSEARAVQPMAAEAAPAPPPPAPMMDSRTGADSTSVRNEASSAAKASPALASRAFAAPNTISWRDAQTGKTLTLSGSLPVERLQEIRKRIEKERAAANKKVP